MPTAEAQRIAIIDLGSNTARLIVMQAVPGHAYKMVDEIREVVRLRHGMTKYGLSEDAIERAFVTLRLFKRFCDSTGVDVILPTATSAVREAPNGPQFVERVETEIGFTLKILDGETEGYYAAVGALNEIPMQDGYVLDIGGGSIQLNQIKGRRVLRSGSVTLGALALTEDYVRNDPVTQDEVDAINQEIYRQLDTLDWLEAPASILAGVGGTIRNLARIEMNRRSYPLNTLHGVELSKRSVETSIALFRELPLSERRQIPGLNADRADIILPGAMVLHAIFERLGLDRLTVSVNGLREGVFFERFWEHLSSPILNDIRGFSTLNMARIYGYLHEHSNHVRYLSTRLFDQLQPLHQYGITERTLIEAASLLHDVGTIINYADHHKHSQTLIANGGLPGYLPREVALISLMTRYHRRGYPTLDEYESITEEGDLALLQKLAAMLRLAEYLERGRNATVQDVTATWNEQRITLTLVSDEYPAVELWQAERKAIPLMEEAFGKEVCMETIAAPGNWGQNQISVLNMS